MKATETKRVTCPDCEGYKIVPGPCPTCNGEGEIEKESKSHYSLAKSKELKAYENAFILQCRAYRNNHINVPFEIELDCFYPTKRSDLDNSLKVIMDCLQVVEAISNDNLCERIVTNKHIDKDNPRIEFTLRAKEPLKPWVPKIKKLKVAKKVTKKAPLSNRSSDIGDRIIQMEIQKPLF